MPSQSGAFVGDSPSPSQPGPAQGAGPTPRQTQRGCFYGTIPCSAGCWSHSGLATVSSLRQPILASLLPQNRRRNPFLRGLAALQTPCAPEAHRRVFFKSIARVHHTAPVPLCIWAAAGIFLWTFCLKRRLAEFIGSYTPPESRLLQLPKTNCLLVFSAQE